MLNRFVLAILLASILAAGCKQSTDSSTNNGTNNTPTEVTFVEQTGRPQSGGSVSAFTVSPSGIVVAIVDGRLMKVDAAAMTLTQIGTDTTLLHVASLSNTELIATTRNEVRKYDISSGSFTTLTLPTVTNETAQPVVTPTGDLYIVNSDGFNRSSFYRSTDNGSTWTKVVSPDLQFKCYLIVAHNGDLLSASASGVFRSSDNATTWTKLTSSGINFVEVRVFESSNGNIFYWAPKINGMQVSRGGGAFTNIETQTNMPPPEEMTEGDGGALYATGYDVQNGSDVVISALAKSTDAGTSWTTSIPCTAGPVVATGGIVYVGTINDAGILKSSDAKQWQTIGRRSVSSIFDFGFDVNQSLLLSAEGATYRANGSSWNTLAAAGSGWLATDAQSRIAIVGVGLGVLRSTDNGATWATNAMPTLLSNAWPTSIMFCFNRTNGYLLLGLAQYNQNVATWTNGLLSQSTDGGKTFTTLTNGTNFTTMTENPSTGKLYAHTENFIEELESADFGQTWHTYGWNSTPLAFTNAGTALFLSSAGFKTGTVGSTAFKALNVQGMPAGVALKRIRFDSNDKMYVLSPSQTDGSVRLYRSQDAVR
ncbi:MAG: exo-alpha-sialidase [Bacteroidetes bacterium]|nr:exo-alpha-sialidase [Bacteroidota bacterium]